MDVREKVSKGGAMKNIYTGVENSDRKNHLAHWKYLSKKRVNGRWVYTYKNREYEKAKIARDATKKYEIKKGLQYAASEADLKVNRDIALKDGKITNEEARQHVERSMYRDSKFDEYEKAGERYVKSMSNYRKVSIKTLPSRLIGEGAAAVSNIASKIGSILFGK